MSRREPVGHTCPDIDEVKAQIEAALQGLKELQAQLPDLDDLDHPANYDDEIGGLDSALGLMEDLRTANAALRDWGGQLAEENEIQESKIEDLQAEVGDLAYRIEELEADREEILERAEKLERELENRPVINPPSIQESARLNS